MFTEYKLSAELRGHTDDVSVPQIAPEVAQPTTTLPCTAICRLKFVSSNEFKAPTPACRSEDCWYATPA